MMRNLFSYWLDEFRPKSIIGSIESCGKDAIDTHYTIISIDPVWQGHKKDRRITRTFQK